MYRMRLSTVFELLLIFIFIAFAASRHVGGRKSVFRKGALKQAEGAINPYCSCTALSCNCCRDFSFPIVSVKGPGCAAITYKNGDVLRLTMSFGNRVLRNITLVGKRPKPVCMGLPGGLSKFCGRLYNIERDGDKVHACLALELRALDDVEAALRLSCFKFGPDGVKLEPGQPIPTIKPSDEDDDDDDYDLDDDDDDLDDDDDDEEDNGVDSGDYTGFGALSDELLDSFFGTGGGDANKKKRPTTSKPVEVTTKAVTEPPREESNLITSDPSQVMPEATTHHAEATSQSQNEGSSDKKTDEEVMTTMAVGAAADGETATSETTETEDDSTEATQRVVEEEEEDEEEEDDDEDEENPSDEEGVKMAESDEQHDEDEDDDEDEEEEEDAEKKDDDDDLNILESLIDVVEGPEKEEERRRVDRMFPGLGALLRPSPRTPALDANFPPVRSARTHRRMRLPPLPTLTKVEYL